MRENLLCANVTCFALNALATRLQLRQVGEKNTSKKKKIIILFLPWTVPLVDTYLLFHLLQKTRLNENTGPLRADPILHPATAKRKEGAELGL